MGTVETALLVKYGIPLAVKLLSSGKSEADTVVAVVEAIDGLDKDEIVNTLVDAGEENAKSIVDGLFDLITGVAGGLAKLLGGLFR